MKQYKVQWTKNAIYDLEDIIEPLANSTTKPKYLKL